MGKYGDDYGRCEGGEALFYIPFFVNLCNEFNLRFLRHGMFLGYVTFAVLARCAFIWIL